MTSTRARSWYAIAASALAVSACAHDGPSGASPAPSPAAARTASAAPTLDVVVTASAAAPGGPAVAPRPTAEPRPTVAAGPVPEPAEATDPAPAAPRPDQPGVAPERSTAVIPADATATGRDLAAIAPVLRQGVQSQPFGKTFAELVKKAPAPPDPRGVGGTASHPDLSRDPIEVQSQVQYLEETKVEARFGHASLRVVRQFRYGRLGAAQLVIEAIGRDAAARQAFEADVLTLAKAYKDPIAALGLDPARYRAARNDLAPLSRDRPLRVVIEPFEEAAP